MEKEKLLKLIEDGESSTIEFKTSFSKDVIETVVAFANTKGGEIVIGISPKKEIIGVSFSEESLQIWANEIKLNTTPNIIPEIELIELNGKYMAVMSVSEYPIKPVACKNKYFKRVLNSNHLMSADEIANEHLKTINSSWDFYPDPYHTLEDISFEKIQAFIKRIESRTGISIILSPFEFLAKLEFIRDNKLTFGSYLLFVKDYCLISDIQIGRFKSEITIIDSASLRADIITEVEEVISFIRKHLMVEYIITSTPAHTERFDYPLDAIREIVINMIVHRDYRESSGSIIKIFDNRIEFYNPGKLYGGISLKDLLEDNYTSQTRNKLIANAFKEIGLIERYGSGIKRIRSLCESHGGISVKFEEVFNGFRVTLEKIKNSVTDKVTDKVTDNQMIIINMIRQNPRITTIEMASKVGISQRKIKENLAKLKKAGFVKRVGEEKKGHWEVL